MVFPPAFTRFLRYALVGLATNLAGYLIYLLVTFLGVGPKVTMTILYVVGASLGFYGNRQWAFRHDGNIWHSAFGYLVCHAGGYAINFTLLYLFVDRWGYPHQPVQAVAILVVAAYLFVVLNLIVFRTSKSGDATK